MKRTELNRHEPKRCNEICELKPQQLYCDYSKPDIVHKAKFDNPKLMTFCLYKNQSDLYDQLSSLVSLASRD